MYNLLIGLTRGEVGSGRLLEHTADEIRQYIAPAVGDVSREVRVDRLLTLPALVMPETGSDSEIQVARVGYITSMVRNGRDYRFTFHPNPAIAPIPSSRIETMASTLQITDWEFHRTHWAVKDVDLYRIVDQELSARVKPKVWNLPVSDLYDPDLVALMMPFGPGFDPVHESLKTGIEAAGMRCLRADNIWERDHILEDVLGLIWRARVIVADLSDKNSNVFYEAGIAHTLGRDTILIAQSMDDIPFDLRAIRTLGYLNNGEGLEKLAAGITERLRTIISA